MKRISVAALAISLSAPTFAGLITIEPDDYAAGTNLTNISEYVTITTLQGGDVYSSVIDSDWNGGQPNELPTGPLGDRVFSARPDGNTEWTTIFANQAGFDTLDDMKSDAPFGHILLLEFSQAVDYISLLSMDLTEDASPGYDHNMYFFYDSNGDLIHSQFDTSFTEIPVDPALGWEYRHGYGQTEFYGADIRYVVVSGDSEPATIDRLTFRTADVPEPSTLALLGLGLAGIGWRRRKLI